MKSIDIHKTLQKLNIKKNDVVMLHGDAIVAAQMSMFETRPLNFLNSLMEFHN